MNGFPRLAMLAGAAIIAVFAVGGLFYLGGSRAPSVGGGVSAAPSQTASSTPSPSATLTPSPTPKATWTTYHSDRYGFDIGQPPGWTVRPADRRWTFAADATTWLSTAEEALLSPAGDIRVAAWSVALDPGKTLESTADIEAWVEAYCQKSNNTPCTGIHERAVPLCLERRDCHPGLLVPFKDDVQAFFTAGIYNADEMIVVTIGRGESHPTVMPYGGAQRLLEAFLSTMEVWPESVRFEERVVREVPIPSLAP